jgi:GNAT superfamily N-acetyltransferase
MIAMQISVEPRALRQGDVAAAVELSTLAGWNQTAEDWRMLLDLAPAGCFAIETEGQLASTTTLVSYGKKLAWIGMVLTRPAFRGRGFARRLLGHALDYANSLGIETVKLDATDQGRHLYESFGFRAEQSVERWVRAGDSNTAIPSSSSPLPQHLYELDFDAVCVDRANMLEQFARRRRTGVYMRHNAFSFVRSGRNTAYLGPCIASGSDHAGALVTDCIQAWPRAGWSWDLLPVNRKAVELASRLGFIRQRQLTRMTLGKPLRGRDESIYAIAGFELG